MGENAVVEYLMGLRLGTKVKVEIKDEGTFTGTLQGIKRSFPTPQLCLKDVVFRGKLQPGDQTFDLDTVENAGPVASQQAESNGTSDAAKDREDDHHHSTSKIGGKFLTGNSDRNMIGFGKLQKRNNHHGKPKHLDKFKDLNMPLLLKQVQLDWHQDPTCLQRLPPGGSSAPLTLPKVTQAGVKRTEEASPQKTNSGGSCRLQEGHLPAKLEYVPDRMYLIEEDDSQVCEEALLHLTRPPGMEVAVSVQGELFGSRHGEISLLSFATRDRKVFTFDLVSMAKGNGGSAATSPRPLGPGGALRTLLESPDILKVMHDCRLAADGLLHAYGIRLANVTDTQAIWTVLGDSPALRGKCLLVHTKLVAHLAMEVLGVDLKFVYFPVYRLQYLRKDTGIWHRQRPLSRHLLLNSALDVMYLLDLRRCMSLSDPQWQSFFSIASGVFLESVRSMADPEKAKAAAFEKHLIPRSLKEALPETYWTSSSNPILSKRFNVMARIDPGFSHEYFFRTESQIRFSRDISHIRPRQASALEEYL